MRSFIDFDKTFGGQPPELGAVLARIDTGRGQERLFEDQVPELLQRLSESARVASITASNAIEGVVLDPDRAERIAEGARFRNRNEKEFAGYRDAIDALVRLDAFEPLSVTFVLHLHRLLFRHAGGRGGYLKSDQNLIVSYESGEDAGAREFEPQGDRRRSGAQGAGVEGDRPGKLVGPVRRRQAVAMLRDRLGVSERWACRVVGQHRSTQRHEAKTAAAEQALRAELRAFSVERPRWGYRRAHDHLRELRWDVNRKRVQRLWREEGLRVPVRKRKRRRLGESTVPAQRLRAERPNHVWAFDFQFDQTADGRALKLLNIVDEFTRESLVMLTDRYRR